MAISTVLNRKVLDVGRSLRVFALAGLVASAPLSAYAIDCDTDGSTCNDAQQTAQTACNSQDLQAGMTAAQMAQAQSLTAQANAANAATTTTGSSTSAQCENQAALSGILSALSALKASACKSAASDCNDTCESLAQSCDIKAAAIPAKAAEYKAHASAARGRVKMCSAYGGNSTLALVQAAALMANMFMNNSCAASTSSATPTPIDCTNPAYAAVTQACICAPVGSNAYANPQSSLCTSGSVTGTAANLSGSGAITPTTTDTTSDGTGLVNTAEQKPGKGGTNEMGSAAAAAEWAAVAVAVQRELARAAEATQARSTKTSFKVRLRAAAAADFPSELPAAAEPAMVAAKKRMTAKSI